MANALGLIGFIAFIVCVIALAASITWLVVRISPVPGSGKKKPDTIEPSGSAS